MYKVMIFLPRNDSRMKAKMEKGNHMEEKPPGRAFIKLLVCFDAWKIQRSLYIWFSFDLQNSE